MVDLNGFLMIEPTKDATEPLIDATTMRMTALLRTAKEGTHWCGWHTCFCSAESGCCDLLVVIGGKERKTNSLAVHYVACHREEIPVDQLALLQALSKEATPTKNELAMPTKKAQQNRQERRKWRTPLRRVV